MKFSCFNGILFLGILGFLGLQQCLAAMPVFCSNTDPNLSNCAGPVDNLATARTIHGSAARPGGFLPPWVNLTLATQGQKAVNDFLVNVILSHLYGLTALLAHPDVTTVLIFTGKSGTIDDSLLRYQSTATQVLVWYQDLFQPDPVLQPLIGPLLPPPHPHNVFISLNNVRNTHIERAQRAADKLAQMPPAPLIPDNTYDDVVLISALSGPFFQDLANSDIPAEQRLPAPSQWTSITSVPINQQAQVLTQYAFMGFGTLASERLGMFNTEEDRWAFNHLWAVLGYAIGINDEFNIALQPNLTATRAYCQEILKKYTIPSLFNMEQKEKVFIERLPVQALNNPYLNQPLTLNVVLYRILTLVLQIPAPLTYATLTPTEQLGELGLEAAQEPYVTNPVVRTTTNTAVGAAFYAAGVGVWGSNYTTQNSRAKYIYYN